MDSTVEILKLRMRHLSHLRNNNELLAASFLHYSKFENAIDFIEDWGMIHEPRAKETSTKIPLIPFDHQRKTVRFLLDCYDSNSHGLIEKSRDMGITWICCALSVWFLLFRPGSSIGWGSRKEPLVDKLGDMDSIFEKLRFFIYNLPVEFIPKDMVLDRDMKFMSIRNPANGSNITGEVGDNIGRGGRKTLYFLDEAAHIVRPEMIEASLTSNTNIRIDLSSVNGSGNMFYRKRQAGEVWDSKIKDSEKVQILILDWSEHPHKSRQWYNSQKKKYDDLGIGHIFSSEIDRDYLSSVKGIIIRPEWVKAAVGLGEDLKAKRLNVLRSGLDVADDTKDGDRNALCHIRGLELPGEDRKTGIEIFFIDSWGGIDTSATAVKANRSCLEVKSPMLFFDSIGIGAGVKGEMNSLQRRNETVVPAYPWVAGKKVNNPRTYVTGTEGLYVDGSMGTGGVRNEDFFENLKAQAWWEVRGMFHRSYKIRQGEEIEGEFISISNQIPSIIMQKLIEELSRPTHKESLSTNRMVVDKQPDGQKSPDMGDAVVMACYPAKIAGQTTITENIFH